MSVKKDTSGRRSVQVEVEVPGRPEEVWQAIATGPGVSPWFVPTEARSGGTWTVRLVHSLFVSSDDWDDQLESIEAGWPDYFRILKLYLTYFRGQPCSSIQFMSVALEPASTAWDVLTGSLGLADATLSERRNTPVGAPPLAGRVELTGECGHPHQLLLQLDEPTPGIVHLFALPMCSQVG